MAGRPKGLPKTGGRKKGTTNIQTTELKDMILSALGQAGGIRYLVNQAADNPTAFIGLLAKVLPRDVNANVSGTLTLEQLLTQSK